MKVAKQSIYKNIQDFFDRICLLRAFECAERDCSAEIINFWEYVFDECLLLMKQVKQMAIIDRDKKTSHCSSKYNPYLNNATYQDIACFFMAEKNGISFFSDKKKYLNYALCKAYHPFVISEDELREKGDVFIEDECFDEKNKLFVIAKKMEDLQKVLIVQKDIALRQSAVQKIFV